MMTRGKARKDNSKPTQIQEEGENNATGKVNEDTHSEHMAMDSLLGNIGAIHKEIQATRSDVKEQLSCLCGNFSVDMKRDLTNF